MPLTIPRQDYYLSPADWGLLAESMNGMLLVGTSVPATAGTLYFVKLRLLQPASVTNVLLFSGTVGSTLTSGQCFAALYTGAGAKVGVTADQQSSWQGSTGLKTMALASGPFSCAAGDYYVAWWHQGTTAPAWARGASIGATQTNVGLAAPNFFTGTTNDTGLTTTAPLNLGTQTAGQQAYWAALT